MSEQQIYYAVGKPDAVAEIMMLVRERGEREALREIAQQLVDSNEAEPNPHAKWYLANHPGLDNAQHA